MNPGPLSGVLVIDLTRVLAGPFCTMMLGELGARVIKIENPKGGDDSRQFDPFFEGSSAYFASLNRGKESMALNLKDDNDRVVFLNMVRRADVLVENYRPGTLEKLGLGCARLQEINPRLIYASVSGFGHSGPWKAKPAYDMIVQALGGLMSLTGQPGTEPTKAGTSIGDITGGLFCLAGITSALYHRTQTGRGIQVDVSMLDGQIAILESGIMRYMSTGKVPGLMGNRHPSICPFGPYATADRPLVIAIGNDTLFCKLCQTLGCPELAQDPRFDTNQHRNLNTDVLEEILENIMRQAPLGHWQPLLDAAGIPCCPVNTVADAVQLPQVLARNMIVQAGNLKMAGNPIKSPAFADPTTRKPAPKLDADGARLREEFEHKVD